MINCVQNETCIKLFYSISTSNFTNLYESLYNII